jgi:4-aminobutyrate aminotransferase-like enzyme
MYKFNQTPIDCDTIITKHRRIVTPIPAPSTIEILKACAKNEPNSMNDQLPIVWDVAHDFYIRDNAGNQWIDFTSSIFVANVGHANPKVIEAIRYVIDKKLLNAYYYPTQERADFSELMVKVAPVGMDKALFLSTGSEAVEAAIKMVIKFTNRKRVLSFDKAFHGKTMGSAMACGKGNEWVPIKSYVDHIPFPNSWDISGDGRDYFHDSVSNLNPEDYAAVIIEPYQGWSAQFIPEAYAESLRKWCDDNGILLIIDEIQSGFGRTGKMFAFEHFNIVPDIITCAKGISSSLPLSCVLTRSEILNTDMSYNSTHGGNPIAVAAANASVQYILDNDLVVESERKGVILGNELRRWQTENPINVGLISQRGLLASVFIHAPDGNDIEFVDRLIEIAMRRGLMSIRTSSGTLKIGPPLTITDDALIEGVQVLKDSLLECLGT